MVEGKEGHQFHFILIIRKFRALRVIESQK